MTSSLGSITFTRIINLGKPVKDITDRAKRYRAQQNVKGPKKCVVCGAGGKLDVMHLSGDESDGASKNLAYGCRRCNAALSAAFKKIGSKIRTRQYNPVKGVPTFEQYAWAVSQQRHSGEHGDAGAIIHATPKSKRTEYARRILAGVTKSRRDEVPF